MASLNLRARRARVPLHDAGGFLGLMACRLGLALLTAFAALPAHSATGCTIGKVIELPVTMDGLGPMIDAKINGTPVRLMVDSGSFFSILSPGSAAELHLATQTLPFAEMRGLAALYRSASLRPKAFRSGAWRSPACISSSAAARPMARG